MISEKDKWLFLYTLPCHRGIEEVFQRIVNSENSAPTLFLNGDYKREAVRAYFLGEHNLRARNAGNIPCMLIPYQITNTEPVHGRIVEMHHEIPNYLQEVYLNAGDLEKAMRFGVLDDSKRLKLGDIVFLHGGFIVDIEFCNGK